MRHLLLTFLFFYNFTALSQPNIDAKWSGNLYQDFVVNSFHNLGTPFNLYKIANNHVVSFNQSTFSYNSFSLDDFSQKGSFDLFKINKTVKGVDYTFKLLRLGYMSLVHFNEGRIGFEAVNKKIDKTTKSNIFSSAFFPLSEDFSSIENVPTKVEEIIQQKNWKKTRMYLDQIMHFSNENYTVFRNRKKRDETTGIWGYDIIVKSKNNEVMTHSCNSQSVSIMLKGGRSVSLVKIQHELNSTLYNEVSLLTEDNSVYFLFNANEYLKQSWDDSGNVVEIYSGRTNKRIASITLKRNERVTTFDLLGNGNIVLGGISGLSFEKDKTILGNLGKKTLEISSLFKIITNSEGKKIDSESVSTTLKELNIDFIKPLVHDPVITDEGGVLFPITNLSDDLAREKLSIVGLNGNKSWKKDIPFNQAYPKITTSANVVKAAHLSIHFIKCGNNGILAFNDHAQNHDNFDYNAYTYSPENVPEKYICSKSNGFSLLTINKNGEIVSQFINKNEEKMNLTFMSKIDNEKVFFIADHNKDTRIGTVTITK